MIQPKSVKDKIAMFNKRIAKAETEKAMKKVSQSLLQIQQQQPTLLEKIYQQRVHSAAQFENIQYNISDIIEFVSANKKGEVDQEALYPLDVYVSSPEYIKLNIQNGPDFIVVDNQEKYTVNLYIVKNRNSDQIYQLIVQDQKNHSLIDVIDVRLIEAFVLH